MENIVGAVFKFLTELHDKSKVSKAEVYAVSGSKQFISETRVQWYHLFRNVADYLYQHNRYLELRKLTWFALTSSFFKKSRKIHAELKFIFLQAHFKYTNFFEKDVVSLLAHHPLALCVKMNTNRAWNFSARVKITLLIDQLFVWPTITFTFSWFHKKNPRCVKDFSIAYSKKNLIISFFYWVVIVHWQLGIIDPL